MGLLLGSLKGKVFYRSRDAPARGDLIQKVIRQIESQKPEVIIIGSSVVGDGVSAPVFQARSGLRAHVLWNPGAASASWYLMITSDFIYFQF